MKVYEITIKPLSGFGTPLKGDTIFGHFCWQIAYDETLVGETLDELLSNYQTKPFVVFSSAYPKFCVGDKYQYAFKTPDMPPDKIFILSEDVRLRIKERKEYKKKRWMILQEDRNISFFTEMEFLNDKELLEKAIPNLSDETKRLLRRKKASSFMATFNQPHNTINRLTGTTGEDRFAPFSVEHHVYYPETELTLFVGIDETVINIEQIRLGFERIGDLGFGKDASSGLGRFQLGEYAEIELSQLGNKSPNACYTLSPFVPEADTYSEMFFTPFTRFGRHGDVLAKSGNPFKNPVIMADEGGIFIPKNKEIFSKPYIGRAVADISKIEPKSVTQGYSLYIPVRVEA